MSLNESPSRLVGTLVQVEGVGTPPEHGVAAVTLSFSNGAWLQTDYWRVLSKEHGSYSSFDHRQKYGLPAPFDAIAELRMGLGNRRVERGKWDSESGDLLFEFSGELKLQILNLSAYERWQIRFPDGTGEYSNYAKP